jgi:hypothetical protein
MDENKLDKVVEKIDEIRDDIADIKIDLARHILRTDLAEENIKILRNELKPVERHVEHMSGGLKLLSVLIVIAAVVKLFIEFL